MEKYKRINGDELTLSEKEPIAGDIAYCKESDHLIEYVWRIQKDLIWYDNTRYKQRLYKYYKVEDILVKEEKKLFKKVKDLESENIYVETTTYVKDSVVLYKFIIFRLDNNDMVKLFTSDVFADRVDALNEGIKYAKKN